MPPLIVSRQMLAIHVARSRISYRLAFPDAVHAYHPAFGTLPPPPPPVACIRMRRISPESNLAVNLIFRWAALLDMFQVKWRGFGAALLVRLVEALLANAASPSPSPPPPNDAAHPSGAGVCSGGGGSGDGGGLERQAAFIEVWVRHLLSRRWHLRGRDVSMGHGGVLCVHCLTFGGGVLIAGMLMYYEELSVYARDVNVVCVHSAHLFCPPVPM